MPAPARYIIPDHRVGSQSLKVAMAFALSALENAGIAKGDLVLVTPTKGNLKHTTLAAELGEITARKVEKREVLPIDPGHNLRYATPRTLSGVGTSTVVIAYYFDDAMLDQIDGLVGLVGVVVVPDDRGHVQDWEERWNPAVYGEDAKASTPLIGDPVVEKALLGLTRRINLSNAVLHPRDKEAATETLNILRANGHSFERRSIKSWAIQNQWKPEAAAELAALASRIGKRRTPR